MPFGPFRTEAAPVTLDAHVRTRAAPRLASSDFYAFPFLVYRTTLSSQDGPRCSHWPTCSLYGVQAVRRHRILGFALAVDRLWRQDRSSALRPLPRAAELGISRLHDPLDAGDFWLRGIPDARASEEAPRGSRQ